MSQIVLQANNVTDLYRGSDMFFIKSNGTQVQCLANTDPNGPIRTTISGTIVGAQVPNGPYAGNFTCDSNRGPLAPPAHTDLASVETDPEKSPEVWLHWFNNGVAQKIGFH